MVGNLREGDAALEYPGGETGEVADHPAAQRDHQALAVDFHVEQRAAQPFQPGEAFADLARRHDDGAGIDTGLPQGLQKAGKVDLGDMAVGHNRHHPLGKRLQQGAGARQRTGRDMNVVGAPAEADGNLIVCNWPAHDASHSLWAASAATILSTSTACGSSPESRAMSAWA